MSPETLTHIVYVVLVIAFVSTISYMFFYNIRARARQRSLETNGRPFASHEAGIVAAQVAGKRERRG